ncbi:hypothetical protein Q669_24055 [Labrenzia sp. C1B10]|uniref:hypothetical protein n=1 Tax=unclassified Labrenzia TaxID=2648686 RepID=UPI0003B89B2F|nr:MULTISPECIES: hypothetical protein [unclassified Labrenzia]ERP98270.1 hypothetical protein Q669_24055 [Labrenzia sp. C1B10]ERS02062.1 hypothetical protein Q675_08170 [Labrenzia sp. C1B70]
MDAIIIDFLGFSAHPDTDHTATDMHEITGAAEYIVRYPSGVEETLVTGLRAGENHGWSVTVAQVAQAWKTSGGVIPEWNPPTPGEVRASMPTVTARQLRHGLLNVNMDEADVEALIAAMPDEEERKRASIDWRTANEYERLHPLVVQISASLGLTPELVDSLWDYYRTI